MGGSSSCRTNRLSFITLSKFFTLASSVYLGSFIARYEAFVYPVPQSILPPQARFLKSPLQRVNLAITWWLLWKGGWSGSCFVPLYFLTKMSGKDEAYPSLFLVCSIVCWCIAVSCHVPAGMLKLPKWLEVSRHHLRPAPCWQQLPRSSRLETIGYLRCCSDSGSETFAQRCLNAHSTCKIQLLIVGGLKSSQKWWSLPPGNAPFVLPSYCKFL